MNSLIMPLNVHITLIFQDEATEKKHLNTKYQTLKRKKNV